MKTSFMLALGVSVALTAGCGMNSGGGGAPANPGGTTTSTNPGERTTINGDLFMTASHYHGAFYYQDPEFDFTVNNTSASTLTVPYTIRADGVDIPGFPKTVSVPANGKSEVFHNPYTDIADKPVGMHTYTVVLDPLDRLGETNEGNNLYRFVIDVPTYVYRPVDAASKVDLQFVDPHVHGPEAGRLAFDFIIKNVHPTRSCGAFSWSVSRKGSLITLLDPNTASPLTTRVSGLTAGEEAHIIGVYNEAETEGDVSFTITIDTANEVEEAWEDNNAIDRIVVMNPASAQ